MPRNRISRRQALRSCGATVASCFLGGLSRPSPPCVAADDGPRAEPLIDTHFHLVNLRLPGVPTIPATDENKTPLPPFDPAKQAEGIKQLAQVIQKEMKDAGFGQALCMPRHEVSDRDPLGVKDTQALAAAVEGVTLHPVGLVHPERFDRDHLALVEEVLREGKVKALKVYLGYLYYGPYHLGYRPYYKLAAKYKTPVVFHTGDTFSRQAKLKYAHPKLIDEVAVDFPDTKFVLAHFGNPWITDAAAVVFKNKNVWADLSGILIGSAPDYDTMTKSGVLQRTVDRIKQGIEYVGDSKKFLFGSDWPLSPLGVYREFVERMFPKADHPAVFRDNAKKVFFEK